MKYYQSLDRLINIMNDLRDKCPWDKKQTIQSLRPQTIEELYELTDELDQENWQGIKEELGDLLLHIVFYSKIASEEKQFTIGDVIETVSNKLIHRHPHIYSNVNVKDEEEVKKNWEQLKKKEGKKSVLSGIAKNAPAMQKAISIQRKVKQVGFDWDEASQVYEKVQEEIQELKEAIDQNDSKQIENEFGDVLFSMINYARFINVDPEKSLELTNQKFIRRFQSMEEKLAENQDMKNMNLEELNVLWEQAKQSNESL